MRKILFRADAKPSIGTGDLVSLVHLSRYFEKAGWETHFIIRNYQAGITIVEKHSIENLLVIDDSVSIDDEVVEINNYIVTNGIDVIFFEITERTLNEYRHITNNVLKACVCFDGIITDDIALVVNWDVIADNFFDTSRHQNTKFLLGTEYVILPIVFDLKKAKARQYTQKPETLMIAMGGADELNFTKKIVDVLIQEETTLKINILLGSGYKYKDEIKKYLNKTSIQFEIKQNVINMFNEYMNCDIAIGAGGLTSYELIATRTPAILVATYEHQIARCIYFDKKGLVKYLGFRSFDQNLLIDSINKPLTVPNDIPFNTNRIVESVHELL